MGTTDPASLGRIVVFAGSARHDSVNKHVARAATTALVDRGCEARFLDLAEFEMPLYHDEIEQYHGVPDSTRELAAQLEPATGLLIASPEYNGAMTALLKNTVDWLTRVDYGILADKYVGLMSATPGRTGGSRGLGVVRHWFELMGLPIAEATLSIPNVHDVIDTTGDTVTLDTSAVAELDRFLDAYLQGLGKQVTATHAA